MENTNGREIFLAKMGEKRRKRGGEKRAKKQRDEQ
jgi:hypothetical protein